MPGAMRNRRAAIPAAPRYYVAITPKTSLKASLSISTIRDFESGKRAPIANNLEALRRAIDAAGVLLVFKKGKPVGIAIIDDQTGVEGVIAAGAENAP